MLSSIFEITALISRLSRTHRRLPRAHLSVPHAHIPQFTTRQRLQLVIPPVPGAQSPRIRGRLCATEETRLRGTWPSAEIPALAAWRERGAHLEYTKKP